MPHAARCPAPECGVTLAANGMDAAHFNLVTDHTSFYERYGWQFYCMVQGDGEKEPSRLYIHTM